MNLLYSLLWPATISLLGWTLLHFLWQGSVIALFLALTLSLLRKRAAQSRYLASCLALLLLSLCPPITLSVLYASSEKSVSLLGENARVAAEVRSQRAAFTVGENAVTTPVIVSAEPAGTPAVTRFFPALIGGWLIGIMLLSLRTFGGWITVQRLAQKQVEPPTDALNSRMEAMARQMSIRRPIRLLVSSTVQVPTVFGCLRAVILLPVSVVVGMSPVQIEALLAHELAHIRRHDYLVNLWQTVVETLLFYHPVVWWVTSRIRTEREHCCDDLAISFLGDRRTYVYALTSLEQLRAVTPALAASDGILLSRIRRILGEPTMKTHSTLTWLSGGLTLSLCLASAMMALHLHAQSNAPARISPVTPQEPVSLIAPVASKPAYPERPARLVVAAVPSAVVSGSRPEEPIAPEERKASVPAFASAQKQAPPDAKPLPSPQDAKPPVETTPEAAPLLPVETAYDATLRALFAYQNAGKTPPASSSEVRATLRSMISAYERKIQSEEKRARGRELYQPRTTPRGLGSENRLPLYRSLLQNLREKEKSLPKEEASLYYLLGQQKPDAAPAPHRLGELRSYYNRRSEKPDAPTEQKPKTDVNAFPLQYSDAAEIAAFFRGGEAGGRLPDGITGITEDPRTNSLIIQGTPEALAVIKQRIRLLDRGAEGKGADRADNGIRIELRLRRFLLNSNGTWKVEILSQPALLTRSDTEAKIEVKDADAGFTLSVTPHLNPDGTITLQGSLNMQAKTNRRDDDFSARFRNQVPANIRGRQFQLTLIADPTAGETSRPTEEGSYYQLQLTRIEVLKPSSDPNLKKGK